MNSRELRFVGRVVVVTGGGRGIGRAVCQRFYKEGALVASFDIGHQDPLVAESGDVIDGHRWLPVECDVSSRPAVEDAFDLVREKLGPVGILVNNAGLVRNNLIHKLSDQDWDTVLNVNLRSQFLCSQAAQTDMVAQRFGKIVNVSSQAAIGTERGYVNYSASKAGVQGLTRALALDLGPFGINVNAIAPGHIETPVHLDQAAAMGISYDDLKIEQAERTALKRVGQPADIAGVASFLASEDARHMTGQVLYVTGRPNVG